MSAKPIKPETRDNIKLDWRTGAYSQQDLVDKHKVSKGTINKLCRGVDQDMIDTVTAGIQYRQALQTYDDRMVTAVTDVVDRKTADFERIRTASLIVLDEAMKQVEKGDLAMIDLRYAQDIVGKARENIYGKIDTAIQVNNSAGITQITRRIIDADKPVFESKYLQKLQAQIEGGELKAGELP